MVDKAGTRGADVVVLDLEDGVHPGHKEAAREGLARSVERAASGDSRVVVRVNPPDTPEGERDLEAVRGLELDAVLLPKVESVAVVQAARGALAGGPPLWLMVETARGAAGVFDLAAGPEVQGLVFGSADYRLSLGASVSADESELAFTRARLVLAARAAGIGVWDAPWFRFRDPEGLRRSARGAFALGFDGKSAVHPSQIRGIHEAFAPSPEQRAWAEAVVRVVAAAEARGESVAELDGELIEELHRRQARRVLRLAEAGLAPLPRD